MRACHGAAGNSTIVQNPKLAAQHEAYTYKQLTDFRAPERNNPIMTPIAKALTEEDMHNLAAWLDKQEASRAPPRTRSALTWARKSTAAALPRKTCRLAQAAMAPMAPASRRSYARLAGQHQEYTAAQLISIP
jgi:cytochrome c553